MSRVLQYRSVIAGVINRNARTFGYLWQEGSLVSLAAKQGFCSESLALIWSRSITSRFHTSSITRSEEILQNSQEKSDKPSQQESSQEHKEDFRSPVQSERFDNAHSHGGSGGSENVLDRIRRLSMTRADEYVPSEMAQEKVKEMTKIRQEIIKKGEQWKWDQSNMRPGGTPPRRQFKWDRNDDDGYGGGNRFGSYGGMQGGRNRYNDDNGGMRGGRNRSYDDDNGGMRGGRNRSYDDDYDGMRGGKNRYNDGMRGGGRYQNNQTGYNTSDHAPFGESRNRSFRREERSLADADEEDGPENYELEMQKLRERLHETKSKKDNLKSKYASEETSERSGEYTSFGHDHEHFHNRGPSSSSSYFSDATGGKSAPDEYESYNYQPSDQEINLAHMTNDPDTFGNLSFSTSTLVKDTVGQQIRNELLEDEKALSLLAEEEEDDSRFITDRKDRWTSPKLITKVRTLVEEKKLKEAVDTFLGALKQGGFDFDDRAFRHHFNVLINECADVGYVDMAYRLYARMKERGYKEKPQTMCSLINACANSPWDKKNNLERLETILIQMRDRGLEPNIIHYHALIKAYGRMGETVRAFNVVDQMTEEAKLRPVTSTFNMLLQACITDTKNGFRYALITWRKLQSIDNGKMRPDIFSYNLLLRVVKDCGIELQADDIKRLSEVSSNLQIPTSLPLLPPIVTPEDSNRLLSLLIPEGSSEQVTDITLDNFGEMITLDAKAVKKALTIPTNRLAVLGGVRGILSQMVRSRVGPNLKTLTELVQVSRATDICDVLQLLATYKIKPDVGFFNTVIKQCYLLSHPKTVPDVVKLMNNVYNILPNMVTWAMLALGCQTWPEAKNILSEIETANLVPNIFVFGSLLGTAVTMHDSKYALHVLEEVRKREIVLNEKFVMTIDRYIKTTQINLVSHEMGKQVECSRFTEAVARNPDFAEHFHLLKMRYKMWLQSVEIKVDPENPWKEEYDHFKIHKTHKPQVVEEDLTELLTNVKSAV